MKKSIIVFVAGCLCALPVGVGRAQQAQDDTAAQQAMMQKWMAFMTPGEEHELLKHRIGKWTVRMEMWTAPDAEAVASDGTSEVKPAMGGRYVMDSIKSNFQGQPYEGSGITGYDKLKKKFVSVWIDNFGTGFIISSGTYDADTKSFSYATESPDVELGAYKRTRTVERIVSPDEWVMEMYDTTKDGQEFKAMTAVYKRVK